MVLFQRPVWVTFHTLLVVSVPGNGRTKPGQAAWNRSLVLSHGQPWKEWECRRMHVCCTFSSLHTNRELMSYPKPESFFRIFGLHKTGSARVLAFKCHRSLIEKAPPAINNAHHGLWWNLCFRTSVSALQLTRHCPLHSQWSFLFHELLPCRFQAPDNYNYSSYPEFSDGWREKE